MDGLELRVLGPLRVWCDRVAVPVPAARQRDLLVALALALGREVPTERLVRLLWGDHPPATARNTLHTLVRRLRRRLAATAAAEGGAADAAQPLRTHSTGYRLTLDPERLDSYRFERLLGSAGKALPDDPATAVRLLDQALGLFQGVPLADLSATELLRVERPRLEELRLQAVELRVDARLRCGEHAALIGELRATIADHPLRERPYEQLMTALYRCGRQAEALETYRGLRSTLTSQLGVEPGPAARRLHHAILSGDPALATPGPVRAATDRPVPEPAVVPAQLPAEHAGFTGRTEQLAGLERLRSGADAATVVAIVGTAGVGKSALALHWAHRLRGQFPDGQLFLDLRGFSTAPPLRPVEALGMFLRSLGVAAPLVPADEQEAAAHYRTLLADRRVLVVLDNARDAAQVRPLLPAGRACLTVITSRDRLDPLVALEGAGRLPLEPMPAGESRTLLARALGRRRVEREPAAVDELARQCAHLPLALRIAAAGLGGGAGSVEDYLERLRAGRLEAMELSGDGPAAVRASFDLSYAVLDEPARRLFRLLGCLPIDLTAESAAVLAGVDQPAAGRSLDRLAASHLLREHAAGRYGCHDLLRSYAAGLAAAIPAGDRAAAVGAVTAWYVSLAETAAELLHPDRLLRLPGRAGEPVADRPGSPRWQRPAQALAWLDAERHNLLVVARHAAVAGPAPASWRLVTALRPYLLQGGHLAALRAIAQAAADAAAAEGDPTGLAAAELALGTVYWARARHPVAIDHFRRAVELAEAAGWLEGTAAALTNLANAQQNAGRQAEAAALYARALDCYERLGRPEGRAAVLLNLGNTAWENGQLDRAGDRFREALGLFRATGSRASTAIALNNLGNVLLEQGRPERAVTHLAEALALNQQIGNRVSQAGTLRALATAHSDTGRLDAARELAESALELASRTGNRMYEAATLDTLATIHRRGGRPGLALTRYREALAAAALAGHPHLEAQIQLGLAETYRALGREDLATTSAVRALTIARANDYQHLERQAEAALRPSAAAPERAGRTG